MASIWSISCATPLAMGALTDANTTIAPIAPNVLSNYGSSPVKTGSTPFFQPVSKASPIVYNCGTVVAAGAATANNCVLKAIEDCESVTLSAVLKASTALVSTDTVTPKVVFFDSAGTIVTSIPAVFSTHFIGVAAETFTVTVTTGRIPKGFAVFFGLTSSRPLAVVQLAQSSVTCY